MSVGLEAAVSLCVCVNMHYQQAPASFFPSFIGAPRVDGDSLHALGNQTQKIDLPGVHEAARELDPVLDVGRAAPPLPALVLAVEALLLLIAAAVAQVALRAGRRDGVGHPRRDDGEGERRLLAT